MNKKNVTVLGYNLEIFVGVVGRQVDGKKSEAPKWYKLGAFGPSARVVSGSSQSMWERGGSLVTQWLSVFIEFPSIPSGVT